MLDNKDYSHFRGCLIGGAIGDALGWPVEFLKLEEIKNRFGNEGITELIFSGREKAEITDDTQMTMFTAEGLLRAETRLTNKGICHAPTVIYHAYQRWILTQGYARKDKLDWIYDGWLLGLKELYARRAPGNSCLSALQRQVMGSIKEPINNSKGCGAIMRSAPIGLFLNKDLAFEVAVESAALTHGHPTGYLSAGAFAYLIADIIDGHELIIAVQNTIHKLESHQNSRECVGKLHLAIDLVEDDISDTEAIAAIGEGWIGEEALGIAIYCALKYQNDFKKALITAVNHDGDSDSTGAITGNILGAFKGIDFIPHDWINAVELIEEIKQLADDLMTRYIDGDEWWNRYPGY